MTNVMQLKPVYKNTLEDKVEQLRVLDRELKRITKSYESLKEIIIQEMGDSDRIVNSIGHEIATYTTHERDGFSLKTFQEKHPILALEYKTTTTYKTFRLK